MTAVKVPPLKVMVVAVDAANPVPVRVTASTCNTLVGLAVKLAVTAKGWNRFGALPSETTIKCAPLTAEGTVTLIAKAPVAPVATVPRSEAGEITSQYTLTVLPGLAVAFGAAPITCTRCPTFLLAMSPIGVADAEVSHTPVPELTTANAGAAAVTIESSRRAVMAVVNIFLFICIFIFFSFEFIFRCSLLSRAVYLLLL